MVSLASMENSGMNTPKAVQTHSNIAQRPSKASNKYFEDIGNILQS